jgi:hypothetical protein
MGIAGEGKFDNAVRHRDKEGGREKERETEMHNGGFDAVD